MAGQDHQAATVAQLVFFRANISKHGTGVLLVEPEHAGAAAHIENRRGVGHTDALPYTARTRCIAGLVRHTVVTMFFRTLDLICLIFSSPPGCSE